MINQEEEQKEELLNPLENERLNKVFSFLSIRSPSYHSA